MTKSNELKEVTKVCAILLVDNELTSYTVAQPKVAAAIAIEDKDNKFDFMFLEVDLRADGLHERVTKAAETAKDLNYDNVLISLCGSMDGKDFQMPIADGKIAETLSHYATMCAVQGTLGAEAVQETEK